MTSAEGAGGLGTVVALLTEGLQNHHVLDLLEAPGGSLLEGLVTADGQELPAQDWTWVKREISAPAA